MKSTKSRTRISNYAVKTYRAGFKVIDPTLDVGYQKKIKDELEDKLKDQYRRNDIPMEARCFHENKELFDMSRFAEGAIKEELILHEVPLTIENEFGDEVDNTDGLIELDKVEDALFIINNLRQNFGDKKVGLAPYSKKFTKAEEAQILPMPFQVTDKSDVEKNRHKKINRS